MSHILRTCRPRSISNRGRFRRSLLRCRALEDRITPDAVPVLLVGPIPPSRLLMSGWRPDASPPGLRVVFNSEDPIAQLRQFAAIHPGFHQSFDLDASHVIWAVNGKSEAYIDLPTWANAKNSIEYIAALSNVITAAPDYTTYKATDPVNFAEQLGLSNAAALGKYPNGVPAGTVVFLGTGIRPEELQIDDPTNLNAADTTNADQIWKGGGLGLDLRGTGYTVGVWEAANGIARATHQELTGRVTLGDAGGAVTQHATHVTATIAAAGVDANARGMANNINIRAFTSGNDATEMAANAATLIVTNHSYGNRQGWDFVNTNTDPTLPDVGMKWVWYADRSIFSTEDPDFGKYGTQSRDIDAVLAANPNLLTVWAAGNDRNDALPGGSADYVTYLSADPGGAGWTGAGWYLVPNSGPTVGPGSDGNNGAGYDSIADDSVEKNALIVGAIQQVNPDPYRPTDIVMSAFSSWGPTDDGRVKPDVVGDGVGVYSADSASDTAYTNVNGTSMATPNVAGTAALLIEHYEDLYGVRPHSATMRGLISHTAYDAGNVGPDYQFGWGVMDASAAIRLMDTAKSQSMPWRLSEAKYTGTEQTYTFTGRSNTPLKATIAWTDPAGTAKTALDDTSPVLVNDLDIWVTGPGGQFYQAWRLNPAAPAAAATRYVGASFVSGNANRVDNIEQVLIDAPSAGIYTIHVGHTVGAAFSQEYSLFISEMGDRFETNETLATAADLGVAPGVHINDLSIHSPTDEDWFRVELLRPDSLRVRTTFLNAAGNLNLQVTDKVGTVLASGLSAADGEDIQVPGLAAGTYFVRVFGVGGASNPVYSLAIDPGIGSSTRVLYVNDAVTVDNVYTTAPGNDANDGLSPATPKATIQDLVADLAIGANDLVCIDVGTYSGLVTITALDEGAAWAGVPAKSLLSGSNSRFDLVDADFNIFYALSFANVGNAGITIRAGAVNPSTDNIVRNNRFLAGADPGVSMTGGDRNQVLNNIVSGGGSYGITTSDEVDAIVRGNTVSGRSQGLAIAAGVVALDANIVSGASTAAIYLISGGAISVTGNELFGSARGLYTNYATATAVTGNKIHDNTAGIEGYGTFGGTSWSVGIPNDIYNNTTGILAYYNVTVQYNRIHDNATGIRADDNPTIHHNLIYRNTVQGVLLDSAATAALTNNTIYAAAGDGIRVQASSTNVALRNNIIWATAGYDLYVATDSQQGFTSDYNNLYTTGTGKIAFWQKDFTDLFDWQVEANLDNNSIGVTVPAPALDNPQFVNLASNDYHLAAASTSIDAGDPTSLYSLEPGNNGSRIDLGAYGNTPDATPSPTRALHLAYPNFYTDWPSSEGRAITWTSYDFTTGNKQIAGAVDIDLYQVGVGKVADIAVVPVADGSYGWSPSINGIAGDIAKRYFIRLTSVTNPATIDDSREPFSVPTTGADLFVNDGSLTDDMYTSAVGNNRNTGRSSTDPKAGLIPILRSYDLEPGNTVKIDTGTYNQVRNVVISGNLALGDDEGATFRGPTDPAKVAVLDRANPFAGSTNIELNDGDSVTLEHLTLTGARMGIWVRNNSIRFTGVDLVVSNNVQDGIRVESDAEQSVLDRLTVFKNGLTGVYAGLPMGLISNSHIYDNGTNGIELANAGDTRLENNDIHSNLTGVNINNNLGPLSVVGHANLAAGKGNLIHNNKSYGVVAAGNVQVVGNAVYDQTGTGIFIQYTNSRATSNLIYGNVTGIYQLYGGVIEYNRVYSNSGDGIVTQSSGERTVLGNVVYSNAIGLNINSYYNTGNYLNNLIYDNVNYGVLAGGSSSGVRLANNTIVQPSGDAIRLQGGAAQTTLRNNILAVESGYAISVASDSQVGFSSDFNDFYLTGAGKAAFWQETSRPTLVSWRNTAFQEQNSLDQNPLFVNPLGADGALGYVSVPFDGRDDDFHVFSDVGLGSYHGGSLAPVRNAADGLPVTLVGTWTPDAAFSPTINRGDPADSFANEPLPNGGYVDIGAYGNTAQTSSSPAKYVLVTTPDGGEVWPAKQPFPVRWRAENFGGVNALDFDGGDVVDMGDPASNVLDLGTNATIETWVRFDALPSSNIAALVSKDVGPGNVNKWIFGYANNYGGVGAATMFHINSPGGGSTFLSSNSWTPVVGRWYHLAVVKTGSSYTFYRDGVADGTVVSGVALPDPAAPFQVGRAEGAFGLNGQIDELRLWNTARTPAEISANRHATLLGSEAGLNGYWRFDEGTGTTAADATANASQGTLGAGSLQPTWQVSNVPLSLVNIDLMQDGNPTPVLSISGTPTANDGEFVWSIPAALTPATNYRVRVTRTDGAMLSDTSNSPFEVTAPVTIYYVNDGTANAGDWTTVPGNDANDGLTPATPKATVSAVLQAYDLELGDVIKVDDGKYSLAVNLAITSNDSGVRIEGNTTGGRSSVLDRGNKSAGSYAVELQGATSVTLADLTITGGQYGVFAASNAKAHDFTLSGGLVTANASEGVLIMAGNDRATITGTKVSFNVSYGVDIRGADAKVINVISWGHTYGISVDNAVGLITGSEAFNNQYGIQVYNGAAVEASKAHDNAFGFLAYYGSEVRDSSAYRNTTYGVYLYSNSHAARIRANDNEIGIYSIYGGSIADSRVYHNVDEGIYVTSGYHSVTGNTVYSNTVGVYVNSYGGGVVANNLIYANANQGVLYGGVYSSPQTLLNNTIYQPGGDAVRLQASSSLVGLRNNILWVQAGYAVSVAPDSEVGFTSDYNDYRIEGTGKLGLWEGIDFTNRADWFFEVGLDAHGLTVDPQFVDLDGADDKLGWRPELLAGTTQFQDDGDVGFTTTGSWSAGPAGYGGDSLKANSVGYPAPGPDRTATWNFTGLDPDAYYELAITWPNNAAWNDGARFLVLEGDATIQTTVVNQQKAPADFSDGGANWLRLGVVYVRGSAVSVRVHNQNVNQFAPGMTLADAVRLQKVTGDVGLDDNFEVKAASATLDAGDPLSTYTLEPAPNGLRVNLGHTGNTAKAILSPPRIVQVLSPNGLEKFEAGQAVNLSWRGAGEYAVVPLDTAILGTGPIAYYRLNEAAGTTANDSSGNGAHGTYVNGVTLGVSGAPVAGGDNAAQFDGTNDRVSLPAGFANLAGGFSASLWVFPTATTSYQTYFNLGNGGTNNDLILSRNGSSSDLLFQVYRGTTQSQIVVPGVIENGVWQQFTVTLDTAGTAVVYKNGIEVGRGTVNVPLNATRSINSLGSYSNSIYHLTGKLDEVAFYDRALLPMEVRQAVDPRDYGAVTLDLMQDGNPVPVLTIAASTPNDGSLPWTVPDLPGSGYRIRATRIGEAAVTDDSNDPFVIAPSTGHFYVDPTGDNNNDGRAPNRAVKSLSVILQSYDLDPGDVVEVAAGNYRPVRNVVFAAQDSGVLVQGPGSGAATLDRGNTSTGSYVIELQGATSVTLTNLTLTGAQYGLFANTNAGSHDFTLLGGVVTANKDRGVLINSGNDRVMISSVRVMNNGPYGIYLAGATSNVSGVVSSGHTYGISITGVDSVISNSEAFNNNQGIVVTFGAVAANSRAHDNSIGFYAAYDSAEVRDSETYRNAEQGVYLYSDANAVRVDAHDNKQGVFGVYAGEVRDNRTYHNAADGIQVSSGSFTVSGNVAYDNSVGINIVSYGAMTVANNLVYANSNQGVLVVGAYQNPKLLRNNTVYQPVGDAIRLQGSSSLVDVRNNILWVEAGYAIAVAADSEQQFTADYNDYRIGGGAKFGQWENIDFTNREDWFYQVGLDGHGIAADPQFINFDGIDNQLGWRPELIAGTTQIIDDGAPGYVTTGAWSAGPAGHAGDSQQAPSLGYTSNAPDHTATWNFSGLDPDSYYELAVTWPANASFSSAARFLVLEGDATIRTTSVSEQVVPTDFSDAGVNWKRLGIFYVRDGALSVQLHNYNPNEFAPGPVVADAARIQKVAGDRGADDNFKVQISSPTLDAGDLNSPFALEPGPNGFRVNQGHTGNSADAIPSSQRVLQVLKPSQPEKFEVGQVVNLAWHTAGNFPTATLSDAMLGTAPMAYYRLNEATGTVANDLSGKGMHGTYSNGPLLGVTGAPISGGDLAVQLDGVNDRVALPAGFAALANGFSASMWVYPTAVSSFATLFDLGNGGTSDDLRLHRNGTSNDLIFYSYRGSSFSQLIAPNVLELNVWQHFAVTLDAAGTAVIYKNGLEVARGTVNVPLNVARTVNSLGSYSTNVYFFPGKLDEVAFYDRALNPTEVRQATDPRDYGAVQIELLQAGAPVAVIAASTPNDGNLSWTVPNLPGYDYRVRITRVGEPSLIDSSNDPFVIAPNTGHFFVDPAGDDAKSGRSPGEAVKTLNVLLRSYDLDPGDMIDVAAGSYRPVRNIEFFAEDSGVQVQGPAVGEATLDRGNKNVGAYVVELAGATSVALGNLTFKGGQYGVIAQSNAASHDFALTGGVVAANAAAGVSLAAGNDRPIITGTKVSDNGTYGVDLRGADAQVFDVVSFDHTYGIQVTSAKGLVQGAEAYDNAWGITVQNGTAVAGSKSHNNQYGFGAYYGSEVRDSEAYLNSSDGVYLYDSARALRVRSHDNGRGVYAVYGNGTVASSRIYHNTNDGIHLTSGNLTATGNLVYGNSIGISLNSYGFQTVTNNLVYANTNQGILVQGAYQNPKVVNNTIYQPVGDAVRVQGSASNLSLRNNIIWVEAGYGIYVTNDSRTNFDSDYNQFNQGVDPGAHVGYWNNTARDTLADWRAALLADGAAIGPKEINSLEGDPLFVDIDGADNILGYTISGGGYDGGVDDNFYIKAGSKAIDRGQTFGAPLVDLEGYARQDDPGVANSGGSAYTQTPTGDSVFSGVPGGTAQNWRSDNTYFTATLPFTFAFYGVNYTQVYVSTEGFLQFGSTADAGDSTNTAAELITHTRIAAMWDDLRTNAVGDDIFVDATVANQVTYRWNATNSADSSDAQFATTLFSDGRIRIDYGPGNTNLTPTVGISAGDGYSFRLALPQDGSATLTKAASAYFTFVPGIVDIGAYEFRGASTDTTPPRVLATTPTAIAGEGSTGLLLTQVQVSFSEALNAVDANAPTVYELRRAVNGIFGDGDDVITPVTPVYTYDAGTMASVATLSFPSALVPGLYRLTIRGGVSGAIHDLAGLRLDGDDNGTEGPDYVRVFSVIAPAVTVTPTSGLITNEDLLADTFSVVLTAQPSGNVTIPISSSDLTEGTVDQAQLVFTPSNWDTPQIVTVTGVEDLGRDGNIAYTIMTGVISSPDARYAGVNPADVAVTNNDNDPIPGVFSTIIDAGLTNQKSVVHNLTVTFNTVVNFVGSTVNAFTLSGPSGSVGLTASSSVVAGRTTVLLNFTSGTTFGSLNDGKYSLLVKSANVADTIGVPMPADYTFAFHRLFGDSDGDGDVDTTDFGAFRASFGGVNPTFDYDNDGDVDTSDYGQFRIRYGSSI